MSKGKGIEAYALIVAAPGADEEVLQELMKINDIIESSIVYGEYDIHCKIEVESMDKLREVITELENSR